jgi:hypothetical protein
VEAIRGVARSPIPFEGLMEVSVATIGAEVAIGSEKMVLFG